MLPVIFSFLLRFLNISAYKIHKKRKKIHNKGLDAGLRKEQELLIKGVHVEAHIEEPKTEHEIVLNDC